MAFCIYVSDARKGTTFARGFEAGYLRPDGSLSSDRDSAGVIVCSSIDAANAEIRRRGLTEGFSVQIGKATAFVCCA